MHRLACLLDARVGRLSAGPKKAYSRKKQTCDCDGSRNRNKMPLQELYQWLISNRFLRYTDYKIGDETPAQNLIKVIIFSPALSYCTAELLSSRRRPSSVKPLFSEGVKRISGKFGGKLLVLRTLFVLVFKMYLFFFLLFVTTFFVFVNTKPYGRKDFKRHLL